MEKIALGYKLDFLNPKILTIAEIKEHLSELEIEEISIDSCALIKDTKVIYSDYEHPLVLVSAVFGSKVLSIDSKYYQEHKEEIDDLIEFICRYKKGEFIALADSMIVNDRFCEAIGNNLNIERVRIGNRDDVAPLTLNEYNSLKKGNVEEIRSYEVSKELKDNFDPIILHNRRELIGYYPYTMLQSNDSFYFNNPLNDEELYYLKYINKKAKIDLKSLDNNNYFKVIRRLKELDFKGEIYLYVDNKNDFNNYLLNHLEELPDTQNIFIKSNKHLGLDCDILTYIKNERRLMEMVLPAMNLSPFEKYLFAYNKVKQFKKYKENNEDKANSRNLYQLLDNDYIVCVGFSRLLGDLLEKLGIPSLDYSVGVNVGFDDVPDDIVILPEKIVSSKTGKEHEVMIERGDHARREVHLVDPKYGIDGYFIADPTWDNDMEHDTYSYALMTQDEYNGTRRSNYFNCYGVDELFFVHSLEEFYAKINILLDKNKNKKEADIIRELLDKFETLDNEFYQEIISKYSGIRDYGFNYSKADIQNIFLDIGEHILTKVNKVVSGRTLKEGITAYYHIVLGLEGEELEQRVNETMAYNKQIYRKNFPVRYKVDKNEEKTVLLNGVNKFDVEGEEMGLK